MDTFTETPDFILADYLWRQIEIIENLNDQKNWWSGKKIQHTEHANVGNTITDDSMSKVTDSRVVTEDNISLAVEMWHRIFPGEELLSVFNGKNCYEKSLETDDLTYFIHYAENTPVGISGIYKEPAEQESAWLGWFGVLPKYRRMGYGTDIINVFLEMLRILGYKYARLYTGADNTVGRKFYEHNGFTGEPYKSDKEDLIIYSKSLCDEPVPLWGNRRLCLA